MSSELVLRYVQIGFYASAIAIAWLTYWSAKRTLLNSVNTEYQKRVLDRLAEVSKQLWDEEQDREGGTMYTEYLNEIRQRAREISKGIAENLDFEVWDNRMLIGGRPAFVARLFRLAMLWESDPFLPADLRVRICDFLVARATALWDASTDALTTHHNEVIAGKALPDEAFAQSARAHAIQVAESKGFGATASTEQLKNIRHDIQVYLESFDPLQNRSRRITFLTPRQKSSPNS